MNTHSRPNAQPPQREKRQSQKGSRKVLRRLYTTARWLHVYLSMLLLMLVVFFCITGIVLNHNDWVSQQHSDHIVALVIPPAIQQQLNAIHNSHNQDRKIQEFFGNPPIQVLLEHLQNTYKLTAINSIDSDVDAGEILFDYQFPAGYASAIFNVYDQSFELEYRQGSWITILNDLHKGRHSGPAWSWIIDGSAIFMLVFSLAGLIILLQNKKYNKAGLACGLTGLAIPAAIYFFWVPRLA